MKRWLLYGLIGTLLGMLDHVCIELGKLALRAAGQLAPETLRVLSQVLGYSCGLGAFIGMAVLISLVEVRRSASSLRAALSSGLAGALALLGKCLGCLIHLWIAISLSGDSIGAGSASASSVFDELATLFTGLVRWHLSLYAVPFITLALVLGWLAAYLYQRQRNRALAAACRD
ncbi:MAG: hypothetical protein GXY52_01140 [Chloroflexi bacterium]|nr:hypothetical protein [Chloroflexota bacterium]